MKYVFAFILFIHAFIHMAGFAKAFDLMRITQLAREISKPAGIAWLAAALVFMAALVLFLMKKDFWWIPAVAAAVISQALVISVWQDAKYGTILNLAVMVAALVSFAVSRFEAGYKKDVMENLRVNNSLPTDLLTEADMAGLPAPVKRYLRYVGAPGKPKVKNMRVRFDVQMRARGKEFSTYTSEQYNFYAEPARLFFMKGKMFGLDVTGYHRFAKGRATMDIRLLGLVKVVNLSGAVLDKTETVTLFNDMCLMAPATLIDKRITWEETGGNTVKAVFNNRGVSVTAVLYFNEPGQLVDFSSNDRTEVSDMKQYPFTTPVSGYRNMNGINIWTNGEAIYEYPGGKFTYGKFFLREIQYNCK
jgi:hypothetical protein